MYLFISESTSPGARAIQSVVHMAGEEQNVHWYGHPRLARMGMVRPRATPWLYWPLIYASIGNGSQSGSGIAPIDRMRLRFGERTMPAPLPGLALRAGAP